MIHLRKSHPLPLTIGLSLAAALGACGDDPVGPELPEPGPEPMFEAATITSVETNVNSAVVDITATDYDAARLRLRTPGEPAMTSPDHPFADGVAQLSALGMLAGRTYQIDILLTAAGETDSVATLTHTTGPLPDWLPQVGSAGEPADDGLIGLAHPGGPIIVDNLGRVRWYVESTDPILINFMTHPSGEYTVFGIEDAVRQYRVLNERGEVDRLIGCVDRPTRFHSIRVRPDGDYWALCDETVSTDLSSRGGSADGTVVWTVLQHVDADGTLLFEFNTRDHFTLDDIDPSVIDGADEVNMTHGNAIEFDGNGNILLSFRSLNEITKIDGTTGDVLWRLGGIANQFTIDDPTREFFRQHGVRIVEPGIIQFLDNGPEAPSRLVRYAIDEAELTAEVVLEYVHSSSAWSPVGGNTEVLSDGRSMVSFGRAGRVAETDASGSQTFELTGLEGQYIFRAFRIPSLYASERTAD